MTEGSGREQATGAASATPEAPLPFSGSPDTFISYASQDAAVASALVQALELRGVACWIAPRDVKAGALYADAIVRAINEVKTVVLVLSASSVLSSHVGREIERAASKRKQVIGYRIDAAPLSPELEYFLSNSQWIDVPAIGMQAALAKLAAAVGQRAIAADPAAAAKPPERMGGRAKLIATVVVIVSVGVAAALGVRFWSHSQTVARAGTTVAIADKSIAVLPFVDMSEKKDQEYFADGMAEDILSVLAKIPALKVIGRTSSFRFKGKDADLRTIGSTLGAAYVLEGSVRKAADRVRITAQLIGTQDGIQRWSESYERNVMDVLKLQDEIASGIARALQVTVGATDLRRRSTSPTPEAYDIYLQGRHAYDREDEDGFAEAADHFQQAIDFDPTFADAAAWLALTKALQAEDNFVPVGTAFEQARHAADMAVHLDSKLALAHVALAHIHIVYDWDWARAETEVRQALSLQPRDGAALFVSAEVALTLGRWDEAVRLMNDSLEVDPLYPSSQFELGWIRLRSGRLADAEAAMRRGLQIAPSYATGHFWLAVVLLMRGQLKGALTEVQMESYDAAKAQGLALVYGAMGRTADANQALDAFMKIPNAMPYNIATIHSFRREGDLAFMWLDRAYTKKDANLYGIKGDPLLKNLESDPRYKAFLRKMNLPD